MRKALVGVAVASLVAVAGCSSSSVADEPMETSDGPVSLPWPGGAMHGFGDQLVVVHKSASDPSVSAVDPVTGATRWEAGVVNDATVAWVGSVEAGPVVKIERAETGTSAAPQSTIALLDPVTGKAVWEKPYVGKWSEADSDNLIGSVETSIGQEPQTYTVTVFDATTGAQRWTKQLNYPPDYDVEIEGPAVSYSSYTGGGKPDTTTYLRLADGQPRKPFPLTRVEQVGVNAWLGAGTAVYDDAGVKVWGDPDAKIQGYSVEGGRIAFLRGSPEAPQLVIADVATGKVASEQLLPPCDGGNVYGALLAQGYGFVCTSSAFSGEGTYSLLPV